MDKDMNKEKEYDQYHLRLPKGLKPQLEELAKRDRRSLNQYLAILIEKAARSETVTA